MNGIIRTLTDNIEIEGVESIQIEEGFDGPDRMIKFFDAYGNSKDIPFKTFEMFSFEKRGEVMVALQEKGSLPRHTWLPDASYIVCIPSEKYMNIAYRENGDARFYHIYNTDKIHEIVFEEEEA